MNLPERIRISGVDYRVVQEPKPFVDGTTVLDGSIRYNDAEIHINTDMDDQRIRQVVFHEVFHGIADAFGITASEEDIDRFSHGLIQVLKDNPDLFK